MEKNIEKSLICDIFITKPYFGRNEYEGVLGVLKSGWISQGPKVVEFETAFSHYTGSNYAVAVSSCTAALHLSFVASRIGTGDEVIIPSFTYVATANAVEYVGAKPVFWI